MITVLMMCYPFSMITVLTMWRTYAQVGVDASVPRRPSQVLVFSATNASWVHIQFASQFFLVDILQEGKV